MVPMLFRSSLMVGVLTIAGMTPSFAGSVTINNCVADSQRGLMEVYVGAYNSNDSIQFITYGPIIQLRYGDIKTVHCATARCKIRVQLKAARMNNRVLSGTYSGKYMLDPTGEGLVSQTSQHSPKC